VIDHSIERRRDTVSTERILRSLPEWFGIEESLLNYVEAAAIHESFVASVDGEVVGVALLDRHYSQSAELSLIAVHADFRGRGLGSSLVNAASSALTEHGASLLQVRTVGPSYEDDGYAATRAFYERCGFVPLQEFDNLEWDGPTLILVKVLS
jgi:GNAT superfamily N-acetyltransferase